MKVFYFLILFFVIVSCKKEPVEVVYEEGRRTVFVYMAADNNLSGHAYKNIKAMSDVSEKIKNNNLIVYLDTDEFEKTPRLLKIVNGKDGYKVLKTYQKQNSASKEVFQRVMRDMLDLTKSEEYGLVLWSHGNGWLPSEVPVSYSFGLDKTDKMEINDLVSAIPANLFDFILFDACYMGSIEVLYALRNKTPYIIASPMEILAKGFPYHLIVEDMFKTPSPNLRGICEKYYNHYNSLQGTLKTAGVALINTAALEPLAKEMKYVIDVYRPSIEKADITKIQKLDTYPNSITFDFVDMLDNLIPVGLSNKIKINVNNVVRYKANTPKFKPTHKDEFDINKFCGISTYIPISLYNKYLNKDWAETEWAKAIGYVYKE